MLFSLPLPLLLPLPLPFFPDNSLICVHLCLQFSHSGQTCHSSSTRHFSCCSDPCPFQNQRGRPCPFFCLLLNASTSIGSSRLFCLLISLILTDCFVLLYASNLSNNSWNPSSSMVNMTVPSRLFGIKRNMAATRLSSDAWQRRPKITFLRLPVFKSRSQVFNTLASRRVLNLLKDRHTSHG